MKIVDAFGVQLKGPKLEAVFTGGETSGFDVIYPTMGANVRSQLALSLGADHTSEG